MQKTHYCSGPESIDYPQMLPVKDVNVYMHDSGMMATHDYSCPVCRENKAILVMSPRGTLPAGVMHPCWKCQDKGYQMIKVEKSWWTRLLFKLLTHEDLR